MHNIYMIPVICIIQKMYKARPENKVIEKTNLTYLNIHTISYLSYTYTIHDSKSTI